MKVLFFQLDNFKHSPFSAHLKKTSLELNKRGHSVSVVLVDRPGFQDLPEGVDGFLIGQKLKKLSFIPKHYLAIGELVKILNREKPDLVIARGVSFGVPASIAAMFCKNKPKVFVTIHSIIKNDIEHKTHRSYLVLPLLVKLLGRCADLILPVSKGISSDYERILGGKEKIRTVHDPIISNTSSILSRHSIDNGDKFQGGCKNIPTLLTVGRLSPEKDYYTLIKAVKLLSAWREFRLYIIGGGVEEEKIKEFIKELRLTKVVIMLGRVDNVFKYMARSDVFVLASKFEGLGNVIVEALSTGCKVVSTDCPYGPAEILENGKYGVLVKTGDYEKLASAINCMLDIDIDRELLVSRAQDFSVENHVDKILSYYQDCQGDSGKLPKSAIIRLS